MPVPGRDLFVQARYQGGASLVDQSEPKASAAKANLRALANQRDGAQYDALRATLRALGSK